MADDLHFIPLLLQAFGQPDVLTGLEDAFEGLRGGRSAASCREPFEAFMETVAQAAQVAPEEGEVLISAVLRERQETLPGFVLHRDGGVAEESGAAARVCFGPIEPGPYSLSLSTGRLLWEGELTASHLLWQEAFGDTPWEMAAETEVGDEEPTLTESLLDGELLLQVFPGLEAGAIAIRMSEAR